jgi:hypothetical protein
MVFWVQGVVFPANVCTVPNKLHKNRALWSRQTNTIL